MDDVVRAPSQARSQRTMDEVYRSLDTLLKTKSFDLITISDLAAHADVAVGSIYARFKDKKALLAGLYMRVSEQAVECLEQLATPSKWEGRSDAEMVRGVFRSIDRFYRREGHILSAAFHANAGHINEARTMVWQTAIDRFSDLLIARSPRSDPAMLRLAIKIITRFTTATMQQVILIDWIGRWKGGIPNAMAIEELSRLALDVIVRAKAGRLGAGVVDDDE